MNFFEKIRPIKTRGDFVFFVYQLSKDYRENSESWQNQDIGTFLEALAAWVEDMDGYCLHQRPPLTDKPDWRNVADMLLAAKRYQ